MGIKLYYSFHGSEREGWTVNLYQYVPDKHFPGQDTLASYWATPKFFDTLDEAIKEIKSIEGQHDLPINSGPVG